MLFSYYVCGTSLTSVLGYSAKTDAAMRYSVSTVEEDGKTVSDPWVPRVFGDKPTRPGYWDFTWDPGHGADASIHEHVVFDRARQQFVQTSRSMPYSKGDEKQPK